MSRLYALSLLLVFTAPVLATDYSLGEKVFWKAGARAKIGPSEVHIDDIPFPARVERIEGNWVWLQRAWVHKRDLLNTDEALAYYTDKIDFNGVNDIWWRRRSLVWSELGEFQNALEDCNDALKLNSQSARAYDLRGLAWQRLGDYRSALKDFNNAIDLDPHFAVAFKNRGKLYLRMGNYEQAVLDFSEAFRFDPYDSTAYLNRGEAFNRSHDFDRAVADFRHAIDLDPRSADAYNSLAMLETSCPEQRFRDLDQAIVNAAKACEMTGWKNWYFLQTLATAYAETGDMESAVKWQEQAVDAAKEDAGKRAAFERLQQFRAGRK
jgi:tetratricopeptide (TPR) repeat protein